MNKKFYVVYLYIFLVSNQNIVLILVESPIEFLCFSSL